MAITKLNDFVSVVDDGTGNVEIHFQLDEGKYLCASVCYAETLYKEIYVDVVDEKSDRFNQQLAIVREDYHYAEETGDVVPDKGSYKVMVFADENSDDVTNVFRIGENLYDDEEE